MTLPLAADGRGVIIAVDHPLWGAGDPAAMARDLGLIVHGAAAPAP